MFEFGLYIMVSIKDAPFGVADGDMPPRQDLPTFFLSSMTTALGGEDIALSFSREAMCWNRPSCHLPSVTCFYLRCLCERFQVSIRTNTPFTT